MWNINEEIIGAINKLQLTASVVSEKDTAKFTNIIIKKYMNGEEEECLWDKIQNGVSICDSNAWTWIEDFIKNSEALVFFNPKDNRKSFIFNSGNDIVKTLAECYGFEFYITNSNQEYLLCYNHHDVLIACGKAKEWLENLIRIKDVNV